MTRSIRFQPDPLDHALIDFRSGQGEFTPTAVALILNESFTGCALIIKTFETLKPEQQVRVKVGRLDPMAAKIVWVKPMEDHVIKAGIQFLE